MIAATVSLFLFYFNSVIFAEENYIYFTLLLGAAALFKGNLRLILKTDMVKILTIFAVLALYVFLHNEVPENVGRAPVREPSVHWGGWFSYSDHLCRRGVLCGCLNQL